MATFSRHVDVEWNGSIMEGKGRSRRGAGAFTLPVTFPARIGEPAGHTSPEELIAAAHAACFAMALNATVGRKGGSIAKTRVTATVTADKGDVGDQADDVEADGRGRGPAGHRQGGFRGGREAGGRRLPDLERAARIDADRARDRGAVGRTTTIHRRTGARGPTVRSGASHGRPPRRPGLPPSPRLRRTAVSFSGGWSGRAQDRRDFQ